MSDGAHLGMSAESALSVILSGDDPAEKPTMDPAEMREWILSAQDLGDAFDYDSCARYAARLILEYLLADPRRAQIPTEVVYQLDDRGQMVWPAVVITPSLYDAMKADGIPIDALGLSGFMWGWAVNAARRCCELPPVPNPAIL